MPFEIDTGFEARLAQIGDGDGRSGFYEPMKAAAAAYVHEHGTAIDRAALLSKIAQAARSAPRHPNKHTAQDVEQRISTLPGFIEWVLKEEGQKRASVSVPGTPCDPPRPLPAMSLTEAMDEVQAVVGAFFRDVPRIVEAQREEACLSDEHAQLIERTAVPHVCVSAGVGIGKSEAVIREVVALTGKQPTYRVAYLVPTHKTAEDIAGRLNRAAGRAVAAVWQGLERPDPRNAGKRMCRMGEAVRLAQRAGGSARDICETRKGPLPASPEKTGADTCERMRIPAAILR